MKSRFFVRNTADTVLDCEKCLNLLSQYSDGFFGVAELVCTSKNQSEKGAHAQSMYEAPCNSGL
jgi:hypothetical protein